MYNVSDFKLPTAIIKKFCSSIDCPFVDLPVEFSDNPNSLFVDGEIQIGVTNALGSTLSTISTLYLSNFCEITGACLKFSPDQIKRINIEINNFYRFLSFCENSYHVAKDEEGTAMRLYQQELVWILMKDLVAPAFCLGSVNNCRVINSSSSYIDAAMFVDKDDIDESLKNKTDESFIFLNSDIEYKPYSQAHLFVEAIKANDRCPHTIVSAIISSPLKEALVGALKLAYKSDKEVNDFILCLLTILGIDNATDQLINFRNIKLAQLGMGQNPYMNISDTWWFLGIIEKMLEPARGPDWSTHEGLKEYTQGVWEKIDKEREKRGRAGMPYEALLRFVDGENDPDNVRVIEKALASNRVW